MIIIMQRVMDTRMMNEYLCDQTQFELQEIIADYYAIQPQRCFYYETLEQEVLSSSKRWKKVGTDQKKGNFLKV